ncbi:uncharacterized protein LOC123309772 isoform X2 [Coccinella septempunctata]|uniref:uncharacterized protein LOC123309772 isoform X2 n=1 Tax=Coccinella septempunctata TaxID=41139 RepID=UPI001D080651|nr:uncharacterized protein LOC123309772 isoform X2 [Coccinella septempunctata]
MDAANDPIKALIESTGLTCDDLLQKLLQYKNQQNKTTDNSTQAVSSVNSTEGKADNHDDTANTTSEKVDGHSNFDNSKTTNNICDNIDEQDGSSVDGYNGDPVIHENPQLSSVGEKSNKVFGPVETTTENLSSIVEHQEEISRTGLNNASPELNEDLDTTEPPTCDVNKKSLEDESLSKNQKETSNEEHPLVQGPLPLRSSEECPTNLASKSISTSPKSASFQSEIDESNSDANIPKTNVLEKWNDVFRRKSISNDLVEKLSNRLEIDHDNASKNPENSDDTKENDIEVCQLEDIEVVPAKPLLKLRSDLFANNSKGNFHPSDNEDENEENTPEIKEFLRNVEEVTGEVQSIPVKSPIPTTSEGVLKIDNSRMRRVKMGFVKKRILHKAIKCLNDVESRKTEQSKRNGVLSSQPEKPHSDFAKVNEVSEEEIRKNLKLQLCTLRNRKKTTNLFKDKCKINNLNITYDKKKVLNAVNVSADDSSMINDHQPTSPQYSMDVDVENSISEQTARNGVDSLFSLSTGADFMIVDVQGGVEFPEVSENLKKPENPESTDLIKLTKTKDVTKIKGWQNKKFQLCREDSPKDSPNTKEVPQSDLPKSTSSSKTKKSNPNKEELSPFVSNSLEEFLTENSTLNISYNIPKLGAEETINTEKYNTVIIPQTESATNESEKKEDDDKPKSIKPKTLAEKRRMLEGSKPKVTNIETVFNKTSYVVYNGRKLFVPTTVTKECLVNIKFKPKLYKTHAATNELANKTDKNRKLSLLGLYHQQSDPVSYKPGPLREKFRLQNKESRSLWHTEVRKLPTVKLNIVPEVGKPVPRHLEHFFKFDTKIKEDRLELALSALVDKKQVKQGFSLTVPYANNQKYILVRKRNRVHHDTVYDIPAEKDTVESVLEDIVSYVENKENEDLIVRDAEVYKEDPVVEKDKELVIAAEASPAKKPKRRRMDTELLRLSCKVLSVSVDESEEEESSCQKPFCKLGCVCKSLACTPRLGIHCSKIECMFECNCSTDENISLEGSTLSSDAVTRLEDQAKRNLAKVEKEFTQTIIHTNDKTILIPSSDRNKTKRTKRMPKRYSDFFEDFDLKENTDSLKDERENHTKEIPNCYVELEKLDVKGIIPLCLYHDCYSCGCLSSQEKNNSNPPSDVEGQESLPKVNKKRKLSVEKKKTAKELDEQIEESPTENISDSEYMEALRVVGSRKYREKGRCARIFGVHPEVLARNEIPFYKNKIRSKVSQTEMSVTFDTATIQKLNYTEPFTEYIDVTTPLPILASDRLKYFILGVRPHKRKQTFDDVLVDKTPTKKMRDYVDEPVAHLQKMENSTCNAVFDGEIIVPTNENKDFVKKLGVKSAAPYMRLLPWNDLLRNYYGRKINIWCRKNSNKNMLLNLTEKGSPPGYVEIGESKKKNGIMNWILSGELPKSTPAKLVHLILSPRGDYFEISGICLKNITEEEKAKQFIEPKRKETHEEKAKQFIEPKRKETQEEPTAEQVKITRDSKFFTHKNHNNEMNLLVMTQKDYFPTVLYVLPNGQPSNEDTAPLHVGLPVYESLRWRMLFLNSNFTFLSFLKNNYSIKYTDLMSVVKKAQDTHKTVSLQGRKLSAGYSQKNFGIYAVPKFVDMLFIGPYEMLEDHDLQTLRYLKQELVPTEYFERVQGGAIPLKRKDKWLVSKDFYCRLTKSNAAKVKKKIILSNPNVSTSKQTDENSEYAVLTPLPSTSTKPSKDDQNYLKNHEELQNLNSQFLDGSGNFITSMDLETKAFVKFPNFSILNGKKMRLQDYNCYLMTNIPGFGYLGAVRSEDSEAVEVDWPFGNKVLRFANVTVAILFIKRRFANLLLPVPATFNLRIAVKEDVNTLKIIKPVDPKLLNGTHICGAFGILDSRKLTPELAVTLGTTQEDVLQRLAKRAQFLGSLEIDKLKSQEKALIDTKKELIVKKQTYLKRYMELLMHLPEEKRLKEYAKFRQKLDGAPKHEKKVSPDNGGDCIAIEDSDSEQQSTVETKESAVQNQTPKKQLTMKSILKPRVSSPITPPTSSDSEYSKPVENFKLVKTPSGKMVLIKDNTGASLSRSLSGIKLKIKNNKVITPPE